MPEFAGLGTSLVLIVAVVLWVAYLVPVWTRKREYLATERNAIRLQQTLRIMAESAEAPDEVRLEADARTIAVQQKAVAKEARLKQAVEHAKAVARARELDDQIRAVEREVRAAVKSSVSRSQRLRRTRLACFALVVLGVVALTAGALVPGLSVLLAVGAAVAVLGLVGLVAVNASSARVRKVAEATAPRVTDLVEARAVAAEAVATETRMTEQVVARQLHRTRSVQTGTVQASTVQASTVQANPAQANPALASRQWTPQGLPEQRLRAQYSPPRHPSDELLARARQQLAEDRRAISGPIARVARLEASFEDIIGGDAPASLTEQERRLAQTQPALPIRQVQQQRVIEAVESLEVTRDDAPLETAPDEHRIAARTSGGSAFASMGHIDHELVGLDVHEAFLRRVG